MSDFFEAYKDPRWQRKRLEIMERAGFRCEECDSDSKTLNVHHGYYERGKMPWEYEDESLRCLCEPCHKKIHEIIQAIRADMAGMCSFDLMEISGYVRCLRMAADKSVCGIDIGDYHMAMGAGNFLGVDAAEVMDFVCDKLPDARGQDRFVLWQEILRAVKRRTRKQQWQAYLDQLKAPADATAGALEHIGI